MSTERQTPGGAYVVETNTNQQQIPATLSYLGFYIVGTGSSGGGGAATQTGYYYAT